MIYNIPAICRKPLYFVDDNGVLNSKAIFEQLVNYNVWEVKTPIQKDGFVQFYSFNGISGNTLQAWTLSEKINLTPCKKLYIKKTFAVNIKLFKNKPTSQSNVLGSYDFTYSSDYAGSDDHIIDADISGISGDYWIVMTYNSSGGIVGPEHAVYNFYIV